jgi:hypothetical protein
MMKPDDRNDDQLSRERRETRTAQAIIKRARTEIPDIYKQVIQGDTKTRSTLNQFIGERHPYQFPIFWGTELLWAIEHEIKRCVRETVPEHNGSWVEFFDFWADRALHLPADLAKQVAENPHLFIQAVCNRDLFDAAKPGGKSRNEVEYLLWQRLKRHRRLTEAEPDAAA